MELIIMMGLPGSGKTTKANELLKTYKKAYIIDCDAGMLQKAERKKYLYNQLMCKPLHTEAVIIDGLILTNADIYAVLDALSTTYWQRIHIYHFNEDRDTCLKNDAGRRKQPSTVTIQAAPYEDVDLNKLEQLVNNPGWWNKLRNTINVVECTVQLKEEWYRSLCEYVTEDNVLLSDYWQTGGEYGNCWDSSRTPVGSEEPCEFVELDELLLERCPNISFLMYKKIMRECVTTREWTESQYYGGYINYSCWVCDLPKLHEILKTL